MPSMTATSTTVEPDHMVLGVDTHRDTHHAAVVDHLGREVADAEFATTPDGYRRLVDWARGYGVIARAGVEGTHSYGTALTRHLRNAGVGVVEVDRPDRRTRRARGKSDPVDAYAAARTALSRPHAPKPKNADGLVEAIRVIRITRRSAVKARTQTINQLKSLLVTGPAELREQLRDLKTPVLVKACAALEVTPRPTEPTEATATALHRLALRYQQLTTEIRTADRELPPLITAIAPAMLDRLGVALEVTGQLLTTTGDNPDRLRSEAAFAHLCGVAPIPASSGRTHRHRLNRGGDRAANNAIYTVVLTRLRLDDRTRAYYRRRTAEGLSQRETIRCLQRYVARELYQLLISLPLSSAPLPAQRGVRTAQP
jgi:transposase